MPVNQVYIYSHEINTLEMMESLSPSMVLERRAFNHLLLYCYMRERETNFYPNDIDSCWSPFITIA